MFNKKTVSKALIIMLLLSTVLTGCSSNEGKEPDNSKVSADDNNILVVYTARSESLNNAVIPNFEKDTGIKVEMIVAGTGELLKRVESEKNNPMGDILWAADETMLASKKDLFMEYVSPEDENMIEQFRNKSGFFSPAFADPTVFIVNKNLIGDIKMEGFEDLLNPELKGKIAFGDPANSSSAFQSLAAMLYAMGDGDPMSDKAWDFVDKFIANLDGKMSTSSGQLHKSVADGEYPVGLTWEDPVVNYIKNGAPVEVVFPKEGAIFPGESVQIIKGAKNEENAKKFVDYMLSEKIQNLVGGELTVRPLRKDAKLASYMVPTDDIVLVKLYDEGWVSANKDAITTKFNEHLEKSLN
ncbi:extracellular solute-binding protein [Paratissierella segnis]|jgi:iron(III) transport system substrate-binding protein|uniref:Extracellular solute-binding protein n=1 Tax=Paratissierella segnis TaxID=2763679 RepID=A0A926EX24_9FIRM|nr:extracellular solute-binding protein [Paratissierella segnis]MBC8589127.1 extracellular solute-binding protein [Paratissierella segnis]